MNEAELHQAIAAHRAGEFSAAERHYRAFLKQQPGHGGAHHNLGLIIAQRGAPDEALAHFALACQAEPSRAQNWFSYAKAMLASGRGAEALPLLERARALGQSGAAFEAALHQAKTAGASEEPAIALALSQQVVADDPENAENHFQLGNALARAGQIGDAIAAYRRAAALNPGHAETHFRLGSLLSENGEIAEGFAHYTRRAWLVLGKGTVPPAAELPHKLKHDSEQRDYLSRLDPAAAAAAAQNILWLADGERVPGPAIKPSHAGEALSERWRNSRPQMVVIDDFLTPAALEKLRRYCAGSIIWRRVYNAGYIGATPEDGLACPLMAQIAEEILQTFTGLIGHHRFRYLGAFKYDSALSTGTNIHADNSAVNVNLYIAPDEANLNPESGGLDIWDAAATSEAQMRQLNGDDTKARAFLESVGAKLTRIPHRTNRAVIFKSDLIHKTSDCHFAEGYLNKRINISLLFGDRAQNPD